MRGGVQAALVALGVTGALVAMTWIARESSPDREGASMPEPAAPAVVDHREQTAPRAASDRPSRVALPEADPSAQEFAEREQFHTRVRTFFAEAPALPQSEKAGRAEGLARDITRYEAAGELSAPEALLLKTALIREIVADPAAQAAQIAALQKTYQAESGRLLAQWQARPDPAFELYKAREREIVAEVSAMSEIPDGLSRNEYLRQRLQRAREEASAAAN
jgi:hypothetical protein